MVAVMQPLRFRRSRSQNALPDQILQTYAILMLHTFAKLAIVKWQPR
jgi:hypothetical protein